MLPAAATWCEGEGTVTNSERRVQRVRKVIEPPDGAKDELWIMSELARRLGHDWGHPTAEQLWDEFRVVAPHFAARHQVQFKFPFDRVQHTYGIIIGHLKDWLRLGVKDNIDTWVERGT